jgi:hypothetical protein
MRSKRDYCAEAYRVSTTPKGERRWWRAGELIPWTHIDVRTATKDEVALIKRLILADNAGRVPSVVVAQQLAALMARPTAPTA